MHLLRTYRSLLCLSRFIVLCLLIWGITSATKTTGQPVKVACVGNSVTYGYGLKDPATESYPAVLQRLLGDGYKVGNFGHSGATLLKKGHNPYYKTPEFSRALQMQPDLVVIHLGLNDTDPRDYALYRDAFIPDYHWLIDTFRQVNPDVQIFLCKMTPVFTGHPRFLSSTQTWYRQVQKCIEKVAATDHLPLIDLYANFHDRPDLITDPPTLHPNKAGAAKMAEVIYRHLTGDFGGLKPADIFTDKMVLQRNEPIRIWGTADAGSIVQVEFHGETKAIKVPFNGHWQIQLQAQNADKRPQTMVIRNGRQKISLGNILIGDVWLCSGQSNMAFSTRETKGGDSLIQNSAVAPGLIRLFNYVNLAATDNSSWDSATLARVNQLQFFSGKWQLPGKNSVAAFSAIGYVFAREIAVHENIPVGIIEIAVGGSPLISWIDRSSLEEDARFEPAFRDWQHADFLMGWSRQRAARNLENATAPYQRHPYEPAYNFEAGIAKLASLPVKGVLWYQGASDADNAPLFGQLFPVFVKSWRKAWQRRLPFYCVQLSSLDRPSWNYFRDLQRKVCARIPYTKMVVTSDLGDSLNVHYPDKIPVAKRLSKVALNHTYHRHIEDSGPLFATVRHKGDQLLIGFTHAGGLTTRNGQPLKGFQLIDQRGNLIGARASIQGEEVRITCPPHTDICSIVYGWQPYTRANLINAAGLPASTFKADLTH